MNSIFFLVTNRSHFVNRFTDNIHDTAQSLGANRCTDLFAGINNNLTAFKTISRIHGNRTDRIFTQMLGDFQYKVVFTVINGRICHAQSVVDFRQLAGLKFDVNNSADDLRNFTCVLTHGTMSSCGREASYSYTYLSSYTIAT